jgi:hypothetical protein
MPRELRRDTDNRYLDSTNIQLYFEMMAREYPKGREDHYLPQGYLRGFIDPATTTGRCGYSILNAGSGEREARRRSVGRMAFTISPVDRENVNMLKRRSAN